MKYFIIDKGNNLLLKKLQGKNWEEYVLPTESPVEMPAEERIFDMSEKIGESALAFLGETTAQSAENIEDASNQDLNTKNHEQCVKNYELIPLRASYNLLSHDDYFHACRASAWVYWERTTQFCPVCGARLERHMDMGKRCASCGAEHFPHLAPASIVRITRKSDPSLVKDDEILLVHARNFRRAQMFGLVAGFLEGGETLEECAAREVREEVGIEIKNVKYFGSQPWPYPSGVMIGFTAEYAGGEIKMDDGELSDARFFRKDNLPQIPDKMSIARRLIDDWLEQ